MASILLVKTSSLGDVVHNLPVVSDIRRRLPDSVIDWVVEEPFADIPRLHPGVRQVVPVAVRRWRKAVLSRETWQEIRAFREALRDQPYDHIIDTQGLIKSALVARLAQGRRSGYAAVAAREPLAARLYDATYVIPKNLHAVERNRWLAAAALGYLPEGPLEYGITAPALAADWLPPGPYAVLLTATSRADKLWADSHWLTVAGELGQRGLTCVLPGGTEEERGRAHRLAVNMRRGVAAPALPVREVAQLLAGAAIVIGVDTGLTHLAAALGRPVIALFGGSDPLLTGVFRDEGALNLGRLGALPSPAEVGAAVCSLLDR
ncbi:MAG: lipopolysaccharide heptosyltransferase I [Rhodocyclaceae bacterium]